MPQLPKKPAAQPWYTIRAAGADAVEVLIYGDIGDSWYGESVTARKFVEDLQAVADKKLVVRINSYGGSVADGIAIYNAIQRHPMQKDVAIDGVAVSIASLIAMAGDTISIAENGLLMIHAPWGGVIGNAAEVRRYADVLDKFAEAMTSSYTNQTRKPAEEMRALVTDGMDHWYTAQEAADAGFVDEITAVVDESEAARFRAAAFGRFKIPAAIAAAYRPSNPDQENLAMSKDTPAAPAAPNTPAAPEPTNVVAIEKAAEARAVERLKTRNGEIETAYARFLHLPGIAELRAACLADVSLSTEAAREKLLAKLGEGASPVNLPGAGRIEAGEDQRDKFRAGAVEAIQIRAGLVARPKQMTNEFAPLSLQELARHALRIGGKSIPLDRMEMVFAALTTSDLPYILSDSANKSMMMGYEQAPESYQKWTRRGNLSDFKAANRVGLSLFSSLEQVPEHGEYKMGTIAEGREQIQLLTYGKKFGLSRQAIINDDLGAFTDVPRKMGMAARRKVGDLAYAVLTANGNMSDGVALFHAATHKNLAGSGAAVSVATLSAARSAMAIQKDKNSNGPLNIQPRYLLVPVAVSGVADSVVNSSSDPSQSNPAKKNAEFGRWEIVSDARLDDSSTTAWYAAADGNVFDTVEVAFLDGNDAPTLETMPGWNTDGIEWKVRIDAAAKALEWRTIYKNPGA